MSKRENFEKISKILQSENIWFYTNGGNDLNDWKAGTFVQITDIDKKRNTAVIIPFLEAQKNDIGRAVQLTFKTRSEMQKCLDISSNNEYIAMFNGVSDNIVSILIAYNFTSVKNDDGLCVGVSDKANLTTKNVRGRFTLSKLGEDCFLVAKNSSMAENGEKCFWLIDGNFGYKTVLDERGNYTKKETDLSPEDKVFVITEKVKIEKLLETNIRFEIRIGPLSIMNIGNVPAAKPSQESFLNDDYDEFFDTWKKYARIEYELAAEEQAQTGMLKFSKLQKIDSNSFTVEIESPENNINNFKNMLNTYGFVRDGMPRISIYPLDQNIGKPISGIIRDIQNNHAVIETDFEWKYGTGGIIKADITGSEKSWNRRDKAFARIAKKNSGIPELAKIIRGHRSVKGKDRYPTYQPSENVLSQFNGHPNLSQLNALKLAVNTPDIAIIQGPPGTGKSTVIRAIMTALEELEPSKELFYAKNLLTAYQRDATANLSDKLKVYGLPVPVYTGSRDEEDNNIFDKNLENWISDRKEVVEKVNAQLIANEGERKRRAYQKDVNRWRNEYNASTYRKSQNKILLQALTESSVQRFLTTKLRIKADSLITEIDIDDLERQKIISEIRSLPRSKVSWADSGEERVDYFLNKIIKDNSIMPSVRENAQKLYNAYKEIIGDTPDFQRVNYGIDILLSLINEKSTQVVDKYFNDQVVSLLDEIASNLEKHNLEDESMILLDYYEALNGNSEIVKEDLSKCCTIVAATHQKSISDKIAIGKNNKNNKSFDELDVVYENVLIDEAARSSPPDLLIPMSCATKRIIMVGDEKQLPQFINNDVAIKTSGATGKDAENSAEMKLLKESLFSSIKENLSAITKVDHIQRFIQLDTQYRMPATLGTFISKEFYDGKLKNGGGNHEQNLPEISGLHMAWVSVGINSGKEERKNNSFCRPAEVSKIIELLKKITSSEEGLKYTYGIITFYSQQNELAKQEVNSAKKNGDLQQNVNIECGTVDAMQGKEFDIVFLSMVRAISEMQGDVANPYGFIANKNRQCVALSRAKKCVLVVGDPKMMERQNADSQIKALHDFYVCCKKGGSTHVGIL